MFKSRGCSLTCLVSRMVSSDMLAPIRVHTVQFGIDERSVAMAEGPLIHGIPDTHYQIEI
jgi:hypothetical protein